jgi:AraC-like DNA-binding protein
VPAPEKKRENLLTWQTLAPGLEFGEISNPIIGGGTRWTFPSKGCVWLWLNEHGSGLIWGNKDRFILKPGMYALTGGGLPADWVCLLYPGAHQLRILQIQPSWLTSRLSSGMNHPDMRAWLEKDCPVGFCGLMGQWEREISYALSAIRTAPGKLIAEAKILEWAAVRLFRTSTPGQAPSFCATLRNRNPVQNALESLRSQSDQALDLSALARQVGIAPHYLSRKVRADTGHTLQQHLRKFRIERACEILSSGRMNVTEAALEVGTNR